MKLRAFTRALCASPPKYTASAPAFAAARRASSEPAGARSSGSVISAFFCLGEMMEDISTAVFSACFGGLSFINLKSPLLLRVGEVECLFFINQSLSKVIRSNIERTRFFLGASAAGASAAGASAAGASATGASATGTSSRIVS